MISQIQYYSGSAGTGTLIKATTKGYRTLPDPYACDFNETTGSDCAYPPLALLQNTTTAWANGQHSQTAITYDSGLSFTDQSGGSNNGTTYTTSYGLVTQKNDYDYGSAGVGPLLSTTNINYTNTSSYISANLLNLVSSQTVLNSSGTQMAQTSYAYDEANGSPSGFHGNLTSVTRWNNTGGTSPRTQYVYNSNGMRITMIDPNGNATQYTYDATGVFYNRIQYPTTGSVQHIVQPTYDGNTGLLTQFKDQNGNPTGYNYDCMLRPLAISYPDGGQETATYNYSGGTPCSGSTGLTYTGATYTKKINGSVPPFSQNYIYDGLGRLTHTQLSSDPEGTDYVDTTYDADGRVASVSNPYRSTNDSTYGITQYQYDPLNRVTMVIPPDGSQSGNNITTVYVGNTTTVTDQAGRARGTTTDASGRITQVVEDPLGAGYSTTYGYNALNNLTSVIQGVQTRTFVYDSLSELRSATNPETGTIQYTYNSDGNLQARQDWRGTLVTYGYDSLDRLTSKTYTVAGSTAPTPNVTYTYDSLPASCNSQGRLTSVSTSISTTNILCYDSLGRITQSSQTTGGTTYPFSYTYDLAGHLATETYPSGKVIASVFDGAGRVSNVQQPGIKFYAGDTAHPIQYAPDGAAMQMKLGNGLWEESRYNVRLQPLKIGLGSVATDLISTLNTSNSNLLLLEYGYGMTNNGNLLSQTIRIGGTALSQSYGYDALNRLGTASETGGWSYTYLIDPYGNLRRSDSPYTIDASTNQISLASGYQYDPAGNLTVNSTQQTFAYDAENRQTSFNTGMAQLNATYDYDGDGRRVRKIQGGTTTIFVYDAAGRLCAEYSTQTPQLGTIYVTADHLGSNRIATDASGGVLARHDYDPFGQEIASNVNGRSSILGYGGTDNIRQKFTGKERDAETGLDWFDSRYFSGAQGRFTSPDLPVMDQHINDPQSWNLYAYGRNNPLAYIDPTGREIELIGDEEERKKALELLMRSIAAQAAARLKIEERKQGKDAHYFVAIEGDIGDFRKLGATANDLANLVTHKSTVEFGVTSQDLSSLGGAVTYEKGAIGNANVRVLVNPNQMSSADRQLDPNTFLGSLFWAGQSTRPRWSVQPFTDTISAWHEFGHAWGYINGAPTQVDSISLIWENRMRAMLYGPLGPMNAPRIRHK